MISSARRILPIESAREDAQLTRLIEEQRRAQ
jgi:hypothetical protein